MEQENNLMLGYWLLNSRVYAAAQELKIVLSNRAGQQVFVTVNDWGFRDSVDTEARQYSGWRPFDCPVGAKHSQHKLGRALDSVNSAFSAAETREILVNEMKNGNPVFKDIGLIEVDCD